MVVGLLNQVQIFWQLYLIELIGFLTSLTQAVAFDISKAFDRNWHDGLLHKPKSYGILGQIFDLVSSFFSDRWLWVVLDWKSSEECPVNAGVPQGSNLGPTLFLLNINDFPDDVNMNVLLQTILPSLLWHLSR